LSLDNASRDDPQRDLAWKEASLHRGEAVKLPAPDPRGHEHGFLELQGALFYSRVCEVPNIPERAPHDNEIEYFVLARDPEFDPATGKRTPDIDGSCLAAAYPDRDSSGRPQVAMAFNPRGAELIGMLSRKNVTERGNGVPRKMRHMAVVLDGLVISAPTINSEFRDRATISGSFTQPQVEDLVSILRASGLPARLLPQPVRETVVEAKGWW
jgi:preprotein translocase subunit SecD